MAQPFDLSNRFDILTNRDAGALDGVLDSFTERAVTPATVKTHLHADGSLLITVVVQSLAEAEARAIQAGLKLKGFVREARLEHYLI